MVLGKVILDIIYKKLVHIKVCDQNIYFYL
jgi:hypothetical protein